MHLSTHNWMRAEPLEVTLKRIKKFGYESIEISGEPEQYKPTETRRLLKEYGISCWGAVTLMLGERNLAAKDHGRRRHPGPPAISLSPWTPNALLNIGFPKFTRPFWYYQIPHSGQVDRYTSDVRRKISSSVIIPFCSIT